MITMSHFQRNSQKEALLAEVTEGSFCKAGWGLMEQPPEPEGYV